MAAFGEKWPISGKFWQKSGAPVSQRFCLTIFFQNLGGFFAKSQTQGDSEKSPLAHPCIIVI